jgi:hypothetical protein
MTEAKHVRSTIADLSRTLFVIDREVAAEEERCNVFDRSDARYSMLARTIVARSENLRATIDTLETRLSLISSVATTEVRQVPRSGIRRPRRNASPRRFAAWLRLRLSAGNGSSAFSRVCK